VTQLLFPDNTVLVNFALINRMDLLEKLVNGKGRWCATVAFECARSAQEPGLDAMNLADEIFGSPWYPQSGAERQDIEIMRLELASPGDTPYQHLGEAETLAIMTRRSVTGFFVTDDVDASRLARQHQVQVISTWDLMRMAGRCNFVDPDTLWGYVQTLRSKKRGAPRGVRDRASFDKWLE
jgi:predicted nucleic acid-binding protein